MRGRVIVGLLVLAAAIFVSQCALAAKPKLKFRTDGTFKVVMMSDTQDGPKLDPRAVKLMETILDTEKPDMVIIAGDCVAGYSINNVEELHSAIACVADPMEKRKIPWAIVFGNHDQEHFSKTKMDKAAVLKIYRKYPHNLNVIGDKKISGAGNDVLLVNSRDGKAPIFALWLIDSNDYAPKGYGYYGWIQHDQVNWYYTTSQKLEKKYNGKIPGLMFFHIPLREFGEMWNSGKATGQRNEAECPAEVNSGMFAAILERGDVKGAFCGHEHTNNYIGEWMGIKLGYDGGIGYATYNLPDSDPNHILTRAGRVFLLNEADPWNWETWMCHMDGTNDRVKK